MNSRQQRLGTYHIVHEQIGQVYESIHMMGPHVRLRMQSISIQNLYGNYYWYGICSADKKYQSWFEPTKHFTHLSPWSVDQATEPATQQLSSTNWGWVSEIDKTNTFTINQTNVKE